MGSHTVLRGNLYLDNCSKVTEETVSPQLGKFCGKDHEMDPCKMKSWMHMTSAPTSWTVVFFSSNMAGKY